MCPIQQRRKGTGLSQSSYLMGDRIKPSPPLFLSGLDDGAEINYATEECQVFYDDPRAGGRL